MVGRGSVVIVGGTRGIGRELARAYSERGDKVVITGRDADAAEAAARETGSAAGLALDLTRPEEISERLAGVPDVARLVLVAIDRDANTARDYDFARALALVTLKLVGYTEVVHALASRLAGGASILVFGGLAKDRPYPGSTTVSTVNGGVTGLVRALAIELAPIRVNALHPGIVGDSPMWKDDAAMIERVTARTPIGRPVTMAETVDAAMFLLENGAMNGVNLDVDGGWLLL
jgi:NAD(P)-dependent dehydrogenase (short-subunit alcohol dehydrogenase family)